MTALCAGGSSAKQTGYADTIIATTSIIDAILLAFGGLWLLPFVALIDVEAFDLTTLCTSDPPALPTFTADDVIALANFGDIPGQATVLSKIKDTINHYAWYQFCHCTSGTLTPAPAFPGQPGDVQIPTSNTPTACASFDWEGTPPVTPAAAEWSGATYLLTRLPGTGNASFSPDGTHPEFFKFAPQPPPVSVQWRMTHDHASPPSSGGVIIDCYDSSAHLLGTRVLGNTSNSPNPQTGTVDIPGGTFYWAMYAANPSATLPSDNLQVHGDFFCGTSPASGLAGACATDPQTMALLQQILGVVTLLQRQLSPFAYVPGAVHAGLSGNGTITVPALVGLKIDITTAPTRLGELVGDPNALFGAGWVNLGSSDGFGPRIFITSDPTLVLDVNPSVTTVGYSIPDDVVVSITELIREP